MKTYEQAKVIRQTAQQVNDLTNTHLQATIILILSEQGLNKSASGLLPDSVKRHPDYISAMKNFDDSFHQMRAVNSWFNKNHKKEYTAERKAKHAQMCLQVDK